MVGCWTVKSVKIEAAQPCHKPEKRAKSKHRYPAYTNHDDLNSQISPPVFDLRSQFICNSAAKETLGALLTSQGQMPCSHHTDNLAEMPSCHFFCIGCKKEDLGIKLCSQSYVADTVAYRCPPHSPQLVNSRPASRLQQRIMVRWPVHIFCIKRCF